MKRRLFSTLAGRSKRFWTYLVLAGFLLLPFRLTIAPERYFRVVDSNRTPIIDAKVRQHWDQYALDFHKAVDESPNPKGEIKFPKRTVWTNMLLIVFMGGMQCALSRSSSLGSYESIAVFANGYKEKWIYGGKGLESGVIELENK